MQPPDRSMPPISSPAETPPANDILARAQTAPLDDLPGLLREQAARTVEAGRTPYGSMDEELGLDHLSQPPPAPGPVPVPGGGPGPAPQAPPDLVQQATTILAQSGLLPGPTSELTRDLLAVLQQIAETDAPGLYDLSNPADVLELLKAIVNGTIQLGGNP